MLRARVNVALSLVLAAGCGGGSGENGGSGAGNGGPGGTQNEGGAAGQGTGPIFTAGDGNIGFGGTDGYAPHDIASLRIEPADAVLDVSVGSSVDQPFTVLAKFTDAPDEEVDITRQAVFYVPDNYLVASFPADGSSTLTTRVPASDDEPAQRGGSLTVQAQAASEDGTIVTATTTLLVRLGGERVPVDPYGPLNDPPLPANPASQFAGEPAPARAPVLVYPNDGALLPPNLGRLEVHFKPGATENTLFELRFQSEVTDLVYYTRCFANADFEPGSCALFVDGEDLEQLASSNQGRGPVALTLRGSDEAGTFGQSANFQIEFAEKRMDGAVYYWTASAPPSIMRFDFGSAQAEPQRFVRASDVEANGSTCVGCHALSRQGDKVIFGLGAPSTARLVYVDDMSRAMDDAAFFTYRGASGDPNAMVNGSFNPDGSQFVAVAPTNAEADARLYFHDGTSGARVAQVELPVVPNNPDWSPAGDKIAFSTLGGAQRWRIEFLAGSISYIGREGGDWNAAEPVTLVPAASGKNRFNPTFMPDGQVLLYSEAADSTYSGTDTNACSASTANAGGRLCNGYSDPSAKTWAVAAEPGATPVFLQKAAAPGVSDELQASPPQTMVAKTDLMDTFPKPAPFQITHRGASLSWFTVGSQRRAGLRKKYPNASVVGEEPSQALLWMFALDTGRVKAGEDGSYPGFFLPFQDLKTSNHMAQWTERIVSDAPPPPAPTPPPPAPPPLPILR